MSCSRCWGCRFIPGQGVKISQAMQSKKNKTRNFVHTIPSTWNVAHPVYNSLLFILYVQLSHCLFRNPSLPIVTSSTAIISHLLFFPFVLCSSLWIFSTCFFASPNYIISYRKAGIFPMLFIESPVLRRLSLHGRHSVNICQSRMANK